MERWKSRSVLRRIYTTFILSTALQNFGTRANSFGHGPLDLHDKICSRFFNVDFWNGTPETRTALLNLLVHALTWQRFTCDFKRASGMSGALSRAVKKKENMADSRVEKAIVCLFALKKRKRLSQLRDETRSSLAPFLHTLKQRQYGLLHAILGCIIRDKVILLL